ncbi:DUF6843 domain-containing protein [Pontibacter sp. G13]|uniref:DUF6843 domain-containing protein n=1 Tax=Pontibacter sp. G13 TaxID=3074898 RepID=UPI0028895627|nr:hypothetical protein [Pontibacter sp. G13]WNJ20192.1 hypothetical protein RJD25_06905 [Pontibacter sp. G13]
MAKRKLKKIEKIIITGFLGMVAFFVLRVIADKRPDRDFILPENHDGWLVIEYEVPGAPTIPMKDGVMQFQVSDSGTFQTSDAMDIGWRKDQFFWNTANGRELIPNKVEIDGETHIHKHRKEVYSRNWTGILATLPVGTDTILADGTEIEKRSTSEVTYTRGRKTLEYIYISQKPTTIFFEVPGLPGNKALEDTDDRSIN